MELKSLLWNPSEWTHSCLGRSTSVPVSWEGDAVSPDLTHNEGPLGAPTVQAQHPGEVRHELSAPLGSPTSLHSGCALLPSGLPQ